MPFISLPKKKSGTSFLALRKEGMGYDTTYMWNLKYDTNEFMKENYNLWLSKEKEVGRDKLGVED